MLRLGTRQRILGHICVAMEGSFPPEANVLVPPVCEQLQLQVTANQAQRLTQVARESSRVPPGTEEAGTLPAS